MQSQIIVAGNAPTSFHGSIIPLLDQAYSFARFLSRDADGAQEIVQDAFLRARRDYGEYRGRDGRAWLLRIVRNCYHDWLMARRRVSRRTAVLDQEDDGRDRAVDEETTKAGAEILRLALTKMPRPLREMIVLRELEALSYHQIAEVTSLPVTTIMSRLARARTTLRTMRRGSVESVSAALVTAARRHAKASLDSSRPA